MHKGVSIFPTDASITPSDLARACEERGFESLWVAEHSHIPVSRRTPFPGGGELPKMYYDVMDPFVCLASAATATKKLKVATGVCLLIQRDPIQTAKQVASLDRVSNGRFLFGVGGGWNAEEMENHGTNFDSRFLLLRERVEAMKEIWTKDKAEYHGKLVDFDPIFAWPKPVQKPHPPIHVGGAFPGGARRAVRYGDGWVPILAGDAMAKQISAFRDMAREAGRDPASLEVTLYGFRPDGEQIRRARDAGADRVVFFAPPFAGDAALRWLDTAAAL
jgi:probable F420-dependent oxidoreductase